MDDERNDRLSATVGVLIVTILIAFAVFVGIGIVMQLSPGGEHEVTIDVVSIDDPATVSYADPSEGMRFIIVDVNVTNVGEEEVGLSPDHFTVIMDGVAYGRSVRLGHTSLDHLDVDESFTVSVGFEVPADAVLDSIHYDGPGGSLVICA